MKKILISCVLCLCALISQAQVERPKLLIGLAVDQMRWDYLYYYYNEFGEGGFKRLLNEGFSCEKTLINYTPTVTAIGHTSIYTGSVPALHGIAGNNFRLNGQPVYCCLDKNVKSVGSNNSAGQMSPHNLLATTIGDQLRIATNYQSKVIGIALKDRAAILPAGHAANAAYWWDKKAGHFVTSSFYMDKLPKWVTKFNKDNQAEPGFDMLADTKGITMTFKMAEAALQNEQLGKGNTTDMLCVSVSPTDIISHIYGTRRPEVKAAYLQLDKELAQFLKTLDAQVGRGNYLLFLSADHGGAHNPNEMKAQRIPAGGYDAKATMDKLNAHLQQKFGVDSLFNWFYAYSLHINQGAIAKANLQIDKVKQEAVNFLSKDSQFAFVVDMQNLNATTLPSKLKEQLANGYNLHRSGDIQVVCNPNVVAAKVDEKYIGTTHSAWNPYDAHIPLIFMGWKVEHGQTAKTTHIIDIAPTVCSMLHIQEPNACIGETIEEVADND